MDGIGNSPTPTKQLGAFELPKAPAAAGQAAAGQSPAKPQTEQLAVNVGTGETKPAAKQIPDAVLKDTPWQQPVTAVKAAGGVPKTGAGKAIVTYVNDGDTVKGDGLNCRIDGIDAPEVANPKRGKAGQVYGEESKKTLQDLVLNKEVTVRITKPTVNGSNYGRDLCQIEIHGKDVSTEMVRAGAAWAYTHFNNDPRLKAAQGDAITNKRGLWAGENPIQPSQFRRMQNYGQ